MRHQTSPFTEPTFNYHNLDCFYHRQSILRALDEILPELHGNLLDVGCGAMPYREYIIKTSNVEKYLGMEFAGTFNKSGEPDVFWDGKVMPFDNGSFDCAISTEVLEHCFEPTVIINEIYRVLKPGGVFFLTTPFVWNLHEQPFDYNRFTPFALERLLQIAGFVEIKIDILGGWNASLAQMLGLWVRRSGLGSFNRRLLSLLLKPVISQLLKHDRTDINFNEALMFTGLVGTARKIEKQHQYSTGQSE